MLSLQGKRNSNQDRVLVVHPDNGGKLLAAVADGLGGMFAGDKAAEIAMETLTESADDLLAAMSGNFADACGSLIDAYQRANDRIRAYAEEHGKPGGVGTTLTTWIVSGSRYLCVNIGDSRCYTVNAVVHQVTRDHSVADELLSQGVLSAADYSTSPLRHQLTKSLGAKTLSDPDVFPATRFGEIVPGEIFLLCSDGFYTKLIDEDIEDLTISSDLDATLKELATEALARGTSDNLSAVVIRTD